MEKFVKGDIVIVPFPFSDLSSNKRRPALVLADLPGEDIILCQITSQETKDQFSIPISNSDFISGDLPVNSNIRPTKIFTADKKIIIRKQASLKSYVQMKVRNIIIDLIK